jgi:hypothetical protein
MTKQEAISLMKSGKKLSHKHFTDDEWVKTDATGMIYILEDGVELTPDEFWQWRTDIAWESDWYIFKD